MDVTKYPFDAEFQNKILAVIIRDKSFILKYSSLIKPNYFDNSVYVTLCRIVLDFLHDFGSLPTEASLRELFKEYSQENLLNRVLDKVMSVDLSDSSYVETEILNFIGQQSWRLVKPQIDKAVRSKDMETARTLFDRYMRAEEVQGQQESELFYFQHIDESFRNLKEEMDHPQKIATLIQSMDEILRGGVRAGDLHLLFAPKKKGKSIFLVNMAAAALQQGKKVAYITMELDKDFVEYRVHSRLTGIPDTELIANETKARAALNRIRQLKGELVVKKYPTNALTPKRLQAYLDYLWQIKGFNVDLLLVDYLDIMAVDGQYGKRWEKQGPLSEALRGLADVYHIPIWTVTQAKQSAEGKDVVEGTDMGGDSVKAHTADSVWSLMQTPEEAKADPPVGRLFCNYLRNGAGQGKVLEIKYDKKRMLMTDLIR